MPELPEVEVTARGLAPAVRGRVFASWRHSGQRLRHAVPRAALDRLVGEPVHDVSRRAKYLLFEFSAGWLAVHLGMSGSCRLMLPDEPRRLHDHLWLAFQGATQVVLNDPRRFGSVQWLPRRAADTVQALGGRLGVSASGLEPFDSCMTGVYLHQQARGRQVAVKQWLMEGTTVVGVGNIYACEALFLAGIHPGRAASRVSEQRFELLARTIVRVMTDAIAAGGSTLRDFSAADGTPGRYGQAHQVYGREGMPCLICATPIRRIVQQQRSTFYCHVCQR